MHIIIDRQSQCSRAEVVNVDLAVMFICSVLLIGMQDSSEHCNCVALVSQRLTRVTQIPSIVHSLVQFELKKQSFTLSGYIPHIHLCMYTSQIFSQTHMALYV